MTNTDTTADEGTATGADRQPRRYSVTAPLIQILGHVPFSGAHDVPERTLRLGDVLPDWVPADEVARLHSMGLVGVAA